MTTGEKIKTLRKINKLTQEELANKLFVSRSLIAKWENNNDIPTNENIKLICEFFNISVKTFKNEKEIDKDIYIKEKKKRETQFTLINLGFILLSFVAVSLYFIDFLYLCYYYNDVNGQLQLIQTFYSIFKALDIATIVLFIVQILISCFMLVFAVVALIKRKFFKYFWLMFIILIIMAVIVFIASLSISIIHPDNVIIITK